MNHDSQPYWASCDQRILSVARCGDCSRWFHFPQALCPACLSENVALQPVSGGGTLYTFSIGRARGDGEPPVMGWVELDEQSGLIVPASIVGPVPEIGARMEVDWIPWEGEAKWLPVFRAANGGGA